MYDVGEEDSDACTDQSQNLLVRQSSPIHMQLPIVEIMKVLASYSLSLILTYLYCFAGVSIIFFTHKALFHSTFIFLDDKCET